MKTWVFFLSLLLPITGWLTANVDEDFDEISAQLYLNQAQDFPMDNVDHITTADVQKYQKEYDNEFFEAEQEEEKLRRILLHVMDSVGKLAAYCEAKEHGKKMPDSSQLISEVLPDLLMHSLRMANLFDVDLGGKYEERIDANAKRITAHRIVEALKAK